MGPFKLLIESPVNPLNPELGWGCENGFLVGWILGFIIICPVGFIDPECWGEFWLLSSVFWTMFGWKYVLVLFIEGAGPLLLN